MSETEAKRLQQRWVSTSSHLNKSQGSSGQPAQRTLPEKSQYSYYARKYKEAQSAQSTTEAVPIKVNRMFDQQEQATKEPMLQPRCPCCGKPETIIWVHGHGQCVHCKMNVMPCCDGAQEDGE